VNKKKMDNIKILGNRIQKVHKEISEIRDFLNLIIELNKNNNFYKKGIYRINSFAENLECSIKTITQKNTQEHRD
jgi:hypothetical protein